MDTRFFTKALTGIFVLFSLINFSIKAQTSPAENNGDCLSELFENNCYSSIKSGADGYIYLKSRPFSSQISADINFSVVLKKSVLYVFNVCEPSQGQNAMVLNLYDKDNKLVATGTDNKITFNPAEAGKYSLVSSLEKNGNNCCLILCGMINKYLPVKAKTK